GTAARVNASRIVSLARLSAAGLETSSPFSATWIVAMRPAMATNRSYAAVVTTKPGGTGNPARISSPRLAPLPPAVARSPRPNVANGATRRSVVVADALVVMYRSTCYSKEHARERTVQGSDHRAGAHCRHDRRRDGGLG